mgnify:CR=1 FL=1
MANVFSVCKPRYGAAPDNNISISAGTAAFGKAAAG